MKAAWSKALTFDRLKMVNAESAGFIMWICLFSGEALAEPLVNWTTAYMCCKDYGGLHSMKNEGNRIFSDIKDNQSYWLSGFTKYSDFVSWKSCYSSFPTEFKEVNETSENTVYSCIDQCKQKNKPFDYIGLQNQSCYCLTWNNTNDNNKMRVSDEKCEYIENTHVPSPNSFVNVYQKINDQHVFEDSLTGAFHQQCVNINVTQEKVFYGTESCYKNASGHICAGYFSEINVTCQLSNLKNNSRRLCIRYVSLNWFDAYKECRQFNGNLVSLISKEEEDVIKQEIKQWHALYWTGIFRDFNKEISDKENDGPACLSARKYMNKIVFEPDDCSRLKVPCCTGNTSISYPEISTHSCEIAPSDSVTYETNTISSVAVTTDVPDASAKSDNRIAIISSVSAVAFICIACVGFLIVRKSRAVFRVSKNRTTLHNADNNSVQMKLDRLALSPVETASTTVQRYPTAEEAHYSLPENIEVKLEENDYDSTDKIPANSREKVSERNDNIYSHMSNLNDPLQTDDYDVLCLKGVSKPKKMSNELYGAYSKTDNTLISDNKTVILSKHQTENRDL